MTSKSDVVDKVLKIISFLLNQLVVFDGLAVHTHSLKWFTNFLLQSVGYDVLKLLFCLDLLVENPEGDVFEISNGLKLFFEDDILGFNIDQSLFFIIASTLTRLPAVHNIGLIYQIT